MFIFCSSLGQQGWHKSRNESRSQSSCQTLTPKQAHYRPRQRTPIHIHRRFPNPTSTTWHIGPCDDRCPGDDDGGHISERRPHTPPPQAPTPPPAYEQGGNDAASEGTDANHEIMIPTTNLDSRGSDERRDEDSNQRSLSPNEGIIDGSRTQHETLTRTTTQRLGDVPRSHPRSSAAHASESNFQMPESHRERRSNTGVVMLGRTSSDESVSTTSSSNSSGSVSIRGSRRYRVLSTSPPPRRVRSPYRAFSWHSPGHS